MQTRPLADMLANLEKLQGYRIADFQNKKIEFYDIETGVSDNDPERRLYIISEETHYSIVELLKEVVAK